MQSKQDAAARMESRVARPRSSKVPRVSRGGGTTVMGSEWRPQLGERVCIGGVKQGFLRYFGLTAFAQGCWCGVELDEPVGKNNGTVNGVVYFECRPNHGIFAPVSKVSKLNDLHDWPNSIESPSLKPPSDPPHITHLEYSSFLKSSHSEPAFARTSAPSKIQHFPLDRSRDPSPFNNNYAHREIEKQIHSIKSSHSEPAFARAPPTARETPYYSRDHSPFNNNHAHREEKILERQSSTRTIKCSSSSRSLSKYGYSNGKKSSCNGSSSESSNYFHQQGGGQFEHFQRTPTNSGQVSPEARRFTDMPFYDPKASPDGFLSSFQPHDFSDFEDDNDDRMSVDESLGILTPSQMRDLTLGTEFVPGTFRGVDFPSSESFDDINELPEDEQVTDVSVCHLGHSRGVTKGVEVSRDQGGGLSYEDAVTPGEFLNSISKKELVRKGYYVEALCMSNEESMVSHSRTRTESFQDGLPGRVADGELKEMSHFQSKSEVVMNGYSDEDVPIPGAVVRNGYKVRKSTSKELMASYDQAGETDEMTTDRHSSDAACYHRERKIALSSALCSTANNGEEVVAEIIADGDFHNSPRLDEDEPKPDSDRLLRTGFDPVLKEKLTVSWEDRPESVYTAGSSDTGFEEGMATSLDSTEGAKRFSRDVADEYKMAESNTTSGYSTGLSDSCCGNDLSGKEIPEDSEDAFSMQESTSLSRDLEVATAVCQNDSASDALCETMVEDSTLTEIHLLLLSPEEGPVTPQSAIPPEQLHQQSHQDHDPRPQTAEAPEPKEVVVGGDSSSNPSSNSTPERGASKSTKPEDRKKALVATAKSPKKNVMSKIKAMIESKTAPKALKEDPPPPQPRRSAGPPKKSRWEAVTSKIAASLAEEKTKPKAKRDVRSRVDTNLVTARLTGGSCRSPRLDSSRMSADGSMSPVSACSRERRVATTTSVSLREGRSKLTKDTKRPKSPRGMLTTSRSASPVAASESSTTSVSLTSHNSRSKIAHWKGSNSTIASSVAPVVSRRSAPPSSAPVTKPPLQTGRTRIVTNKKPPTTTVPKIRISAPATMRRGEKPQNTLPNRTVNKEQGGGRGGVVIGRNAPVRPAQWLSKAELGQEIQRLSTLCEARTKELNRLKMETKHVSVGFDAFAALFKYMVEDLNGLSVPMLSADLQKTLKQLELAKQDLAYYEREVEEMKSHHCQELNDLSNKLFEVFQGEVTELSTKHEEEMNQLKHDHQTQIEALTSSLNASSEEARAQQEALVAELQQELINQREELQLFHERELQDLEVKHSQSSKTLQEHIEQMQKKCEDLKQHSLGMEDAMRKDTNSKLQWVTSRKLDLEKEVESLKAVLEMKNKELHTIRVQNLEMEKQLEELPLAREKIKMLQARAEDLEALMAEKTKMERKLLSENQQITETYEKESKVNRRLSMENEELQWRLRQAEQSIVTGSFSEVPEDPEEESNFPTSPAKSPSKSPGPNPMSRSVFFTYVDKDDLAASSSPSAYKKITPGFSANYKTNSPARSSSRNKSHSEPPQPPVLSSSTPRKGGKKSTPKRTRAGTTESSYSEQQLRESFSMSVAGSMASSLSSECSVYSEQKEQRLLEEHSDQILHSLEILREQRNAEECSSERVDSVSSEEVSPEKLNSIKEHLSLELRSNGAEKSGDFDSPEEHKEQILISLEMFQEQRKSTSSSPLSAQELRVIKEQNEQFLRSLEILQAKYNDEERLFLEQHKEQIRHSLDFLQKCSEEDPMSRSSEFSDPKTYYHMTFPGADLSSLAGTPHQHSKEEKDNGATPEEELKTSEQNAWRTV